MVIMKDKKKNVFDTFLEKYDEYSSRKHVELEEYYRPSKAKCIFGFVFCLIFYVHKYIIIIPRIKERIVTLFFLYVRDVGSSSVNDMLIIIPDVIASVILNS